MLLLTFKILCGFVVKFIICTTFQIISVKLVLILYILSIEREGMEVNLAVPYLKYNQIINIEDSRLKEATHKRESLYLNGTRCIYGKRFKLGFIIENIEKSRNKLIEKMNGN